MEATKLRAVFEKRGIRKVKLGGFDVDGILRGKLVSTEKFWSAAEKGFGFCDVIFGWDIADVLYDNGKVTGWHTGYPDAGAQIDLSTFRVFPDEPDTAHFLVDFYNDKGKPHVACPRNLLKRMVGRAQASGYRPMLAAEFEFWVFQETPHSLHEKGFRDLTPISPGMFGYSFVREGQHGDFVHDVLDTMAAYDVPVEGIHTETGPGVYEAALRYGDALVAADQAALFKTALKQIAHRHGLVVTFMAKWNAAMPGSSGHIHQSLWDSKGERNLFADAKAPHGISDLARRFVAGQLALMGDLTAIYSPSINSYKRYVPGVWAPLTASWGVENRTCGIRVINGPGATAARVEFRQTAADINPYIAMAACLGSGLHGVERGLELGEPTAGDATRSGEPIDRLPRSLAEATSRLRQSETAAEVLGEDFIDHYVRTRDFEVREYQKAVTEWELRRYFEAI